MSTPSFSVNPTDIETPPDIELPPDDGEEEVPGEELPPPTRVLVFTKSSGGGSETVSSDIPLNTLDGIDPDELAKDLIPAYEDAGWEFKHLRVTTQKIETYDPRSV